MLPFPHKYLRARRLLGLTDSTIHTMKMFALSPLPQILNYTHLASNQKKSCLSLQLVQSQCSPPAAKQPDLSQLSGPASLIYLWLAPEIRLCSGLVPTARHLHSSPQPSALGYFPQLFKSSPYLKESIKPRLSHSPRQRSLHFKVAGCDAERESARQRDTEREKTSGNSPH